MSLLQRDSCTFQPQCLYGKWQIRIESNAPWCRHPAHGHLKNTSPGPCPLPCDLIVRALTTRMMICDRHCNPTQQLGVADRRCSQQAPVDAGGRHEWRTFRCPNSLDLKNLQACQFARSTKSSKASRVIFHGSTRNNARVRGDGSTRRPRVGLRQQPSHCRCQQGGSIIHGKYHAGIRECRCPEHKPVGTSYGEQTQMRPHEPCRHGTVIVVPRDSTRLCVVE